MIVSPDSFLYIDGTYSWTPKRAFVAWKKAEDKVVYSLRSGGYSKVVLLCGIPGAGKSTWSSANDGGDLLLFDATLLRIRDRNQIKKWFGEWKGQCECVFLNTPFDICVERNNLRTADRRIPDETMFKMRDALVMPTVEEGFDRVEIVQ